MGERGNLREIRDETQRLLDRIDTKLIERQERQSDRQREHVFSRLVRGSVIAGALATAWRWVRGRRAGEMAAVGAIGTVGVLLAIGPPDLDVQRPAPELQEPSPWDTTPIIDRPMTNSPQAAATVIMTPRPEPDSETLRGTGQVGTEPQQIEQAQPEPTESIQTEPTPEATLQPTPTPTTTPTSEPPELDNEEVARQLCLGLENRPVVNLGACIRGLLGLH